MMTSPIFISHVTHLTDARYWAAMAADWISLQLTEDDKSFQRWHTFHEWISGVMLAAEPDDADESLIARCIIEAKPDGLVCDNLEFLHLTGGMTLFVRTEKPLADSYDLITQIIPFTSLTDHGRAILQIPSSGVFIEHDWDIHSIRKVKEMGYKGGFGFRGTPEKETGQKDFTLYDEMVEEIRT